MRAWLHAGLAWDVVSLRCRGLSVCLAFCSLQKLLHRATQSTALPSNLASHTQAKLNCLHPSLFPVLQPPNLGEGAEGELSALAAEPSAAAASTAAAAAAPSTEHSGAAAGAAGVAAGGPKVPHLMRGLSGLKLNLTPIKSQGVDETEVGARDVDVAQVQADFRASAKEAVAASATLQQAAAAVAARGAAAANGRAGEAAEAAAGGGPEAQPVPEALQGIGR